MLNLLARVLTRPATGPIATGAAITLAVVLAISWTSAARREAELKAELTAQIQRDQVASLRWRAQLATCRAAAAQPAEAGGTLTRLSEGEAAERLSKQGPAGFDVCARMEAADAAVLATLKGK